MDAERLKQKNLSLKSQIFCFEETLKMYLRNEESTGKNLSVLYEIASHLHTILHILRQLDEYDIWERNQKQPITCDDRDIFFIFRIMSEIVQATVENLSRLIGVYFSEHTEKTELSVTLENINDYPDTISHFMDDIYTAMCPLFEKAALETCCEVFPKNDSAQTIFTYNPVGNKKITFKHGNLASSDEEYDIVVCSAAKNSYIPSKRTLIAALIQEKGIILKNLAKRPALDLRTMNCWLSEEIPDSNFHRIACVELMSYKDFFKAETDEVMLRSAFITFRYMLEQANNWGIPVKRVALPLLGTGRQKINNQYIAAPLFKQCVTALETIDELEEIVFYELDGDKLHSFADNVKRMIENRFPKEPTVFISYSSKQSEIAHDICHAIQQKGIACWIAPECIPPGSDYLEEIPVAINATKILVLLLTPDAVRSQWVKREVSSAIGSGNTIIPYQTEDFELDRKFLFMMDGIQIYPAWKNRSISNYHPLIQKVQNYLDILNS